MDNCNKNFHLTTMNHPEKTESNLIHNSIKCIGINLSTEVKNLYTKSYKTLTKEIEEDTSGKIMYS
jgi:hypothetical protein